MTASILVYALITAAAFGLLIFVAVHTPPQPHDREAERRRMRKERRRPEEEKR